MPFAVPEPAARTVRPKHAGRSVFASAEPGRQCRPHVHAHRRSSAFLALRAAGVRLDRRLDGRRCGATSCPPIARARCARAGVDALRRRPGAADARGNALAARAGRRARRSSPASSAGSICSRRTSRAQLAAFAAHPKLVGIRHIVQSEPDDRFLLRPAFCRGLALLEEFGLAYDILDIRSASAGGGGARRAVPQPARSCSITSASRTSAAASCASGSATRASWRRARTSGASCRGWSPRRTGRRGRRHDLRPYLDVAFDCFGAGAADDRIGLAGVHAWPATTRATMAVVVDYWRRARRDERDAVLGGNAQRILESRRASRGTHAARSLATTTSAASAAGVRCVQRRRPRAAAHTHGDRLTIAVIPRGRRTCSGRAFTPARKRRARELGVDDHLARAAARRRSRLAGVRSRGVRQPRRLRHRAGAARRGGAARPVADAARNEASRSSSSTRG